MNNGTKIPVHNSTYFPDEQLEHDDAPEELYSPVPQLPVTAERPVVAQ